MLSIVGETQNHLGYVREDDATSEENEQKSVQQQLRDARRGSPVPRLRQGHEPDPQEAPGG